MKTLYKLERYRLHEGRVQKLIVPETCVIEGNVVWVPEGYFPYWVDLLIE